MRRYIVLCIATLIHAISFAQHTPTYTTNLSISPSNGKGLEGSVTVFYAFAKCAGDVVLAYGFNNLNITAYYYNGQRYTAADLEVNFSDSRYVQVTSISKMDVTVSLNGGYMGDHALNTILPKFDTGCYGQWKKVSSYGSNGLDGWQASFSNVKVTAKYSLVHKIEILEKKKQNKTKYNELIAQADRADYNAQKLEYLMEARKYVNDETSGYLNKQIDGLNAAIAEENRIKIQKEIDERNRLNQISTQAQSNQRTGNLSTNGDDKTSRINGSTLNPKSGADTAKSNSSIDNAKASSNYSISENNRPPSSSSSIDQFHQENAISQRIEQQNKIAYQRSVDHKYAILDLELQRIFQDDSKYEFEKQYALKNNYSKRAILASYQYYKGQAERIKQDYHNNPTMNAVVTGLNEVQAAIERNRQEKERRYITAVYRERVEFQNHYIRAQNQISHFEDVCRDYLENKGSFRDVQYQIGEVFEYIEKVNEFDFSYRQEHKDISDMFFRNTQQLKLLYEKMYVKEYNRLSIDDERVIDHFLINEDEYNYLRLSTKKFMSDQIAQRVSQMDATEVFDLITKRNNIVSRSFKDQESYYASIITFVGNNKPQEELRIILNRSHENLVILSLLKTNVDINEESLYQKFKYNEQVQNFIKTQYAGKLVIPLESMNDMHKHYLARNLKTGLFGFTNSNGHWSIAPTFLEAKPFTGGKAIVAETKTGLNFNYYSIDEKGDTIKLIKDTNIVPLQKFSEGFAVATTKNGRLKGYINENFEWVVKPAYLRASNVVNGKAEVKTKTGKIKTLYIK